MRDRRISPPARARASGQRGFTLVELLVAMAAGLVVSLAAFLLSKNATRFFQNEARASGSHLAATIGLNRLAADLQRAAYLSTGNIRVADDPQRCGPPPVAPTGLSLLAGISIQRQGSANLHPSELGQSIVNGMWPDAIVIGGSLNSTEVFEARVVNDAGTWYVRLLDSAALRRTNERALGGGEGLGDIFQEGRFLRISRPNQRHIYAVIDHMEPGNLVYLKSPPGVPTRDDVPDCGLPLTGAHAWVSVISRVRYDIRSLVGKDTSYRSLVAPISPALTGDNGRTELVRVELDDEDQEKPETLELIAEYAVDLKFGISVLQADKAQQRTNPQITRYPIAATDTAELYKIVAANYQPEARPEDVRSVQIRLSTRTRAPDRDVGFPVGPDGRRLRFLIPGIVSGVNSLADAVPAGAPPVFARMRTLYADVALPNQAEPR
ncbi:prepilin-type N-terminal cleavage/methylation domain-containing protein [Sorangium sp. So ce315]|uniref:PilW family protein n=1 Tax=Sorangium sp. So ce315 TaxID=3133299 RepID=UPI003F5D6129